MSTSKAGTTKVVGYALFSNGSWARFTYPVNPGVHDETRIMRAFKARAKAQAEQRGTKLVRAFSVVVRHSHEGAPEA